MWDVNHPDAPSEALTCRPGDDAATTRLSTSRSGSTARSSVLLIVGALGYGIWSSWEAAGTVLLFLVAGLFAIVAGYLAFHERLARLEARDARGRATDDEVPARPRSPTCPTPASGRSSWAPA